MKIVNRGYLIVQPKKPFVDWANEQEPDFQITIDLEPTIYLIEEEFYDDELIIKSHFKHVFLNELDAVSDEEESFPDIKLAVFLEWFSVRTGTTVMDSLELGLDRE
ncbi:MAG: hypothetical protein ACI837_001851 [Crocinitomicaceae bacterium]|jgi:hypothetical protein